MALRVSPPFGFCGAPCCPCALLPPLRLCGSSVAPLLCWPFSCASPSAVWVGGVWWLGGSCVSALWLFVRGPTAHALCCPRCVFRPAAFLCALVPGPWGCSVLRAICFRSWGVLVLNRVLQRPRKGRIYGLTGRMRFAASLSVSVLEWPDKTIKKRKSQQLPWPRGVAGLRCGAEEC